MSALKPQLTVLGSGVLPGSVANLRRFLDVFQRYLGSRLYLFLALTVAAALADGLGIMMLLPLLSSLNGADLTATATGDGAPSAEVEGIEGGGDFISAALDFVGLGDSILAVLLIISGAFVLKGILKFGALGYSALLRGTLMRELRGDMFAAYCGMNIRYYSQCSTGHFVNVINTQVGMLLTAFNSLAQLTILVVNFCIYLALAFVVAWRFGLMAAVLGLLLMSGFRRLNSYIRELSRRAAQENGRLAALLIQTLQAFKYLASTRQLDPMKQNVDGSIELLSRYQVRSGIANAFTQAVQEPVAVLTILVLIIFQLMVLGEPLAPILVAILLLYRCIGTTIGMQGAWQKIVDRTGALELVTEEFDAQERHRERGGTVVREGLVNGIELDEVCFAYDAANGNVLEQVSLSIPVRTSVAFVGESGAGKSTLVDLLTFALRPNSGRILLDGVSSEEVDLASWRSHIGYVSQETVVFDDTVAQNICMWSGDPTRDDALMERIREAARQAHVAEFIESLPKGYHTPVGDRGLRLSGGQRQRLFIARELFREPNLLILDEATSALDSDSERAIQQSIDELRGRVTVVIIAHRLSTIRNVDRVYVFDQGRLVEQGTYAALRNAAESRLGRLVAMQAL